MGTVRWLVTAGLVSVLGTGFATAGPTPSPTPEPPPAQPPALLDRADVDRAVDRIDPDVAELMRKTGVPGVSVAVVYKGEVVHIKGYGVREVGKEGAVDADTVFQLASVSKPIASTVVAGAVGVEGWQKPVSPELPEFRLKDPWVTSHVTVADLFSHRSGLPDHAGDLLEDLGYDQEYILSHLRYEPLAPFRASYAYTNFGLTAAAEAVAAEKGVPWAKLAEDTLYKPAGMNDTSSRFQDFASNPDRAYGHVKQPDGTWEAQFVRDPDAQSPAGGVSSSATDMATWLRLQLANGSLDGRRIVAEDALDLTHHPEAVAVPAQAPAARTGFYGLGWNVSYDDEGRLRLSHTGAFALGAHTNVTMLPGEQLGIVVLTNGAPVGVADAVALDFFDTAQDGKPSRDWLPLVNALYEQEAEAGRSDTDFAKKPADATPAKPDSAYTGTYENDYYGRMTVAEADGGLVLRLGPEPQTYRLTHYDGDTFSFPTRGENAVGPTAVTFSPDGRTVRVEYLDETGLGTFTRG
ncbi:serine hydrolase [Streptomyces sp. NPDC057695]|uniref:serine hydrolase n=1 Tax=Streptomyces sp. NPDC057695 TaxID=3346217 RepID=UPI0036AC993A